MYEKRKGVGELGRWSPFPQSNRPNHILAKGQQIDPDRGRTMTVFHEDGFKL